MPLMKLVAPGVLAEAEALVLHRQLAQEAQAQPGREIMAVGLTVEARTMAAAEVALARQGLMEHPLLVETVALV